MAIKCQIKKFIFDNLRELSYKVNMKVHKSSSELYNTIEGYKTLVEEQKKEIWELKKISSENEKNKNLLQGYKKVIEDLSIKLRKNS